MKIERFVLSNVKDPGRQLSSTISVERTHLGMNLHQHILHEFLCIELRDGLVVNEKPPKRCEQFSCQTLKRRKGAALQLR
jgi:hypothetical protein